MAYLGFQKFLLATSAHTKGGQTKFSKFFLWWKKNLAQWLPKYATEKQSYNIEKQMNDGSNVIRPL